MLFCKAALVGTLAFVVAGIFGTTSAFMGIALDETAFDETVFDRAPFDEVASMLFSTTEAFRAAALRSNTFAHFPAGSVLASSLLFLVAS
jgi:hypothetical protein